MQRKRRVRLSVTCVRILFREIFAAIRQDKSCLTVVFYSPKRRKLYKPTYRRYTAVRNTVNVTYRNLILGKTVQITSNIFRAVLLVSVVHYLPKLDVIDALYGYTLVYCIPNNNWILYIKIYKYFNNFRFVNLSGFISRVFSRKKKKKK